MMEPVLKAGRLIMERLGTCTSPWTVNIHKELRYGYMVYEGV